MLQEKITLSNGVEIPKLGLGTWFIPDDQAAEAVRQAKFIGHGIGLEINEMPVLAPRMKQELEPE